MKSNMILLTVVFIFVFTTTSNVFAQPNPELWTQATFDAAFLDLRVAEEELTITFDDDDDGYIFQGDIVIPNADLVVAAPYRIVIQAGVEIYFRADVENNPGGSLTIQTIDGDPNAVGCIVAEGDGVGEADRILFTSVLELGVGGADDNWGGIIIENDPTGIGASNILEYCEIEYAGRDGHAVYIDGWENDAEEDISAQLVVSNSFIHDYDTGAGHGIYVDGPRADFLIHGNEICNGFRGIEIGEAADGRDIDLEGIDVIANNIIHDNVQAGIWMHNQFTGNIVNNIIYDNDNGVDAGLGITFQEGNNTAVLLQNNVIDCGDIPGTIGIDANQPWTHTIRNNIIINCGIGIRGNNVNNEVDKNLLSGNTLDFSNCCDLAAPFCITSDPEFVGDNYHLRWSSPAINAGVTVDDPDGSDNDMGVYGGDRADDFNRTNYEDYCVIESGDDFGNFTATLKYDTYMMEGDNSVDFATTLTIEEGTTVIMAADASLDVNGTLVANGSSWDAEEGEPREFILFRPDWDFDDVSNLPIGTRHSGVSFDDAIDNDLEYFEIWGSDGNGISTGDFTDFDLFSYVKSHHNFNSGLYIFGSAVTGRTGVDIENSDFYCNNDHGVEIYNNSNEAGIDGGSFYDNEDNGIYVYNGISGIENVEIYDNSEDGIYLNNSDWAFLSYLSVYGNGDEGIYLINDDSEIADSEVRENLTSNGIFSDAGSDPILLDSWIHDNGPTAKSAASAEIRIYLSGWVDISYCGNDITDEDESSYLVYRESQPTSRMSGAGNFWGHELDKDEDEDWKLFHPDGDPEDAGNLNLMTLGTFTSSNDEPNWEPANFDEDAAQLLYSRALIHKREGEYVDAINIYISIIEDYPETQYAIGSLRRIHHCWLSAGRDMNQLIALLEDFDFKEESQTFQNEIFYTLTLDRVSVGDYEEAIGSLSDKIEDPNDEYDCLRALLDREMAIICQISDSDENENADHAKSSIEPHKNLANNYREMMDQYRDGYNTENNKLPDTFKIMEIYPNPFNSTTNISFNLCEDAQIKLTIHDLQGREIAVLYDGNETSGTHSVSWDATGLTSGVYFCRLQSEGQTKTVKLAMIR